MDQRYYGPHCRWKLLVGKSLTRDGGATRTAAARGTSVFFFGVRFTLEP